MFGIFPFCSSRKSVCSHIFVVAWNCGQNTSKVAQKRKVTNGCVLEGRKMRNIGAVAFRSRRKYER